VARGFVKPWPWQHPARSALRILSRALDTETIESWVWPLVARPRVQILVVVAANNQLILYKFYQVNVEEVAHSYANVRRSEVDKTRLAAVKALSRVPC
jgi:hypothetical protein